MPTKQLSHSQRRPRPDWRPSFAKRGYGPGWDKLSLAVRRANPCCTFCDHPSELVDHIKPVSAGGDAFDLDNLRAVCRACHALITGNFKRTGRNEMPAPTTGPRFAAGSN